jgi:hypothetical protein
VSTKRLGWRSIGKVRKIAFSVRGGLACVTNEIMQRLVEMGLAIEVRLPVSFKSRALDWWQLVVSIDIWLVLGTPGLCELASGYRTAREHDHQVPEIW